MKAYGHATRASGWLLIRKFEHRLLRCSLSAGRDPGRRSERKRGRAVGRAEVAEQLRELLGSDE